MKIVTHSGHFHTDDLMAVSVLLLKFPGAEVKRSRDPKVIDEADIAVDVGQIYDVKKLRFDHHQASGAGLRANGIPYASFGLVWQAFGEEIAGGLEEAKIIDERLAMPIDAGDNGIELNAGHFDGIKEYSVGDFFDTFSYGAETLEELDKGFFTALPLAQDLLKKEIAAARYMVAGWGEVKRIYAESPDKRIIMLPRHLPWKRILIPTETLYVVYPTPSGSWAATAVCKDIHTFETKKPFPMSWSGLSGEALQGVTGVKDAVFCHRNLFLAIAETQEGAKKLAEIALNA
jgi:uncharacterized UPF0160 family protein